MTADQACFETEEYSVILVHPASRKLLAMNEGEGYRFPRVRIPLRTRPVEQLQKAIKTTWELNALIVEFLSGEDASLRCALAEILSSDLPSELTMVSLRAIEGKELTEHQRAQLTSLLAKDSRPRVSQIGWLDRAIQWVESETATKLSSKDQILQLNGGGAFALIRFPMNNGKYYWLKATGEPNIHELPITKLLSKLSGDYLPQLIAARLDWNAWLMSGEAVQLDWLPTEPHKLIQLLGEAVESMAELQGETQGHDLDLLNAGVTNQSLDMFQKHSEAMFDFIEEAMGKQISTKVPPLGRSRLQEIRMIVNEVCQRMDGLHVPLTIVHGDINYGNILFARRRCLFIDWCESYLSNPFISLQHLLLLNKTESLELRGRLNHEIKNRYRAVWLRSCTLDTLEQGFKYMPLLAAVSTLYGRGDWLNSSRRNEPDRQTCARSLARHMDRVSREPALMGALCR